MHGNFCASSGIASNKVVRGKARQNLREIPKLFDMHGSRESREFPWLKFVLVVLARDLSWELSILAGTLDIFIEAR